MRRHLARLRHCYEHRLVEVPDLAGTVETTFLINQNGAVVSSTATGVGDAELESCVSDVIRRMEFPRPKGVGLVKVNYPFTFRRTP